MPLYYYLSDFTTVRRSIGKSTMASCPECKSHDNVSVCEQRGFFRCFSPNCNFRGIYAGEVRPDNDGTQAGQISDSELRRVCRDYGFDYRKLSGQTVAENEEPAVQHEPLSLESTDMSDDPWDEIDPSEYIVPHYPKDGSRVPCRHQHYKGMKADDRRLRQLGRLDATPRNEREAEVIDKALAYLKSQRISLRTALAMDVRCGQAVFAASDADGKKGAGTKTDIDTSQPLPCIAYPNWLGQHRCTGIKLRAIDQKAFLCHKASDKQLTVPYGVSRFAPWLIDDTYLQTLELWGGWDGPMPIRADPHRCVIFTEGEHDALALAEAGFLNVISVSSGAGEDIAKTMRPFMQWIEQVPEVVICGDIDEAGGLMKQRLLYLFNSRARMALIPQPHRDAEGHTVLSKDIGDVLRQEGIEAVRRVILGAVTVHSPRVVTFASQRQAIKDHAQGIYEEGIRTGYGELTDSHLQFKQEGGICCVTGYPNSGKSDFLYDLAAHMMILHNKKFMFVSMEQPDHADAMYQLIRIVTHRADLKSFGGDDLDPYIDQLDKLCQFYNFDQGDPSVSEIIQTIELNVQLFKPDFVVVDNYARLKRPNLNDKRETDFIHDLLCELQSWGKRRQIWSFVVAHPRKPQDSGENTMADGSTVSGSAHWYNLSDMAITVKRINAETCQRLDKRVDYKQVHVWKIRDQRLCSLGDLYFLRHPSGRYEERSSAEECEAECLNGIQWRDGRGWKI